MGEDEFRALYERLSSKIFSFAARRLSPEAAKDVVSETFEVVWIKWSEVPSEPDAAAAWIFGVAKNKVLQANQQRIRKHHDHRFAEDYRVTASASSDIADAVTDAQQGAWVYRQFSENERLLFDVAFLQDIDRQTAAAMLGLNVIAFNTRVSRLRSRIADLIRRYEDSSPTKEEAHP